MAPHLPLSQREQLRHSERGVLFIQIHTKAQSIHMKQIVDRIRGPPRFSYNPKSEEIFVITTAQGLSVRRMIWRDKIRECGQLF